ncbi:hypothetical protein CBER1_00181 [Cercospora berteroae]|uniref:Oxidoreductase n=1 Tax=Cercospora berteroae TaxID=357750 RepID=A0A2S6CDA1_9PEZI|nr:hypothetical protein CBER1_00181 [Cercospora berteroae]
MADRWAAVHQDPQGLDDQRPTAKQIVETENLKGKWTDKNVLITGCSSGIGVESARALAETGATLYLTARDLPKAKEALGDLAKSDKVYLRKLDLDSLDDVRTFAREFLRECPKLNILITNAGVMACPEKRTKDGFEYQFGTNHLAHFLLINLLTPALKAAATPEFNSRLVIVSSLAHTFGSVNFDNINLEGGAYDPMVSYAQSKTANLWTANAFDRKYAKDNVRAWSVQPGMVPTNLTRHFSEEQVKGIGEDAVLAKLMKSPPQGAVTQIWAAVAHALEGQGGKYLEDCQIIGPRKEGDNVYAPGYATWAYDPQLEEKLWELSLKFTGLA